MFARERRGYCVNDKGNGVKDRQKANKYKRKRKKNHVWEIDKQLAVAITKRAMLLS